MAHKTIKSLMLALLFWALFLFGWLWPDQWWATHSIAFLPPHLGYVWLVVPLAMILFWQTLAGPLDAVARYTMDLSPRYALPLILLTALGATYLAWRFPIAIDVTGDAMRMEFFFTQDDTFKPGYMKALLDWNLFYWQNGERTVLNGMHLLSDTLAIAPRSAFELMGQVCLFLYVLVSGLFAYSLKVPALKKATAVMLLLLAPYLWQFFGHFEIYAPALLIVTIYAIQLYRFFEKPSWLALLALWVVGYFCIRVHTGHALIVVSLLAASIHQVFRDKAFVQRWFNWKGALLFVFLPTAIGGFYLYFVIFQDHIDPRTAAPLKEQIFLPLFSPMAPLDRYNLLSPAHLFDWFTHVMMLSAAGVFVLLSVLVSRFRETPWSSPVIVTLGTTALLYLIFFFMMNPLLGMPLDVDLFSIGAPFLVMLAIAVFNTLPEGVLQKQTSVAVLALSLFTLPIVVTNARPGWVADKAVSLAVRTYRTYWMGGVAPVLAVANQYDDSQAQFDTFVMDVRNRIDPWVAGERDIEYAEFMKRVAEQYQNGFGNADKAAGYYFRGYQADAGDLPIAMEAMKAHFAREEYAQALAISQHLMMVQYPSAERASRMAIHCALMASDWSSAGMLLQVHTERWPQDVFINGIYRHFKNGQREQLRHAFGE